MSKLAEEIYKWMSNLKGPWIVHKDSFLPANVCCAFAGSTQFIDEMTKVIEKHRTENCDFEVPIKGQEAVVPEYGLGRIISFSNKKPIQYIEVKPYSVDYTMKFDPKNVQLVKIFFEEKDKQRKT